MASVSIKPHIVVWTIHYLVTIWHKPLKRVVGVIICDDWQSWILPLTKLSRFIPAQHWTISVETILLIVHWVVALEECRYDIYGVQQNQSISCKTFAFTLLRDLLHHNHYHNRQHRQHHGIECVTKKLDHFFKFGTRVHHDITGNLWYIMFSTFSGATPVSWIFLVYHN